MRCDRLHILAITGAVCALVAAPAGGQVRVQRGPAVQLVVNARPEETGPKPVPLVNADEEMASYLKQAREFIAAKQYARAIEILQAMLNRPEQCMVPTADPRLFVSLAVRATEVIGQMPPEGLRLYRRLYDPQADRLLRIARRRLDQALLREIISRYFYTSSGDDALNLLASILFDRGEFSQAARLWRAILRRHRDTELDRALLLVKVAVAHHFAAEPARAAAALAELRARHKTAQVVVAGKRQPAVEYVAGVLASAPPKFTPRQRVLAGWPSFAGAPDSVAVMSPCRPVLSPRWTQPGRKPQDNPNVSTILQQATLGYRYSNLSHMRGARSGSMRAVLEDGRVWLRVALGRSTRRFPVAAIFHPVVVGNTILLREVAGVVAYDLLTGERLWDTTDLLPLYRPAKNRSVRYLSYYSPYRAGEIEDEGICTLTVGGGMVFAVGKFPPLWRHPHFRPGQPPAKVADTSVLAAFSLASEGALVWWTDFDKTDEFFRTCKFLSAPTYVNGRLYAVAKRAEAYYLICLDARTGRMLWDGPRMVSQAPVRLRLRTYPPVRPRDFGSPPAVADGRVFVCTNAGVVAAFDAETGRALWAYQYDSRRNRISASRGPTRITLVRGGVVRSYPPNPVIVAAGRVICLPADSEQVLALRADTGELEWHVERASQRWLAAIDESQLLLAGPNLMILDATTGKREWTAAQVEDIHGRPAVTADGILASGRGRVVCVALPARTVTTPPLVDRNAVLGNLVCANGKLVAANIAGLSAYFTFRGSHAELTARLARATKAQRPALLYQRGMNAFNAGKPELALGDLLAARREAEALGQDAILAKAEQGLYRTYVALANRASDNAEMLRLFTKAQAHAYSPRSRGEMLIRLVKYYDRVNQPARAAELAQRLTIEFADTELVDVRIGAEADDFVRDDASARRHSGYELGHAFIRDLIVRHGQRCYAAFDAKASAELAAAVRAGDPAAMVSVADTYRHSVHAPLALLRAGEWYYRQALKDSDPRRRREHLVQASACLSRVNLEYPDSPVAPSASLGRVMVYRQVKPTIIAFLCLQGLKGLPPQTRVSFAGVSGTLEAVLRRLGATRVRAREARAPLATSLRPPLRQLFGGGQDAVILRDCRGRPIRAGGCIFLLQGNKLFLFDPAADSFSKALRWQTTLWLDANRFQTYGTWWWAQRVAVGLTAGGTRLTLACPAGLACVDVRTGKLCWAKGPADAMLGNFKALDASHLVIVDNTGGLTVLDPATGRLLWRHKLARSQLPWRMPPLIAGGVLVAAHGPSSQWQASVYDLAAGGRLLGSVRIGSRLGQVGLTRDGLLVVNDGGSIRMIEPVLGLDQSIWTVPLARSDQAAFLDLTDTHMVVSPGVKSRLVELRSLAHGGGIVRTFELRAVGGQVVYPVSAELVGQRLYVVAGRQPPVGRRLLMPGQVMAYIRNPCLQAFDVRTGQLLWVADLTLGGVQPYVYVMPLEVCRSHVAVLVKAQSYMRDSRAFILDAATGKVVQTVVVSGIKPVRGGRTAQRRYFRHMWLSSPAICDGRVVFETHKGIWVYGRE